MLIPTLYPNALGYFSVLLQYSLFCFDRCFQGLPEGTYDSVFVSGGRTFMPSVGVSANNSFRCLLSDLGSWFRTIMQLEIIMLLLLLYDYFKFFILLPVKLL